MPIIDGYNFKSGADLSNLDLSNLIINHLI